MTVLNGDSSSECGAFRSQGIPCRSRTPHEDRHRMERAEAGVVRCCLRYAGSTGRKTEAWKEKVVGEFLQQVS